MSCDKIKLRNFNSESIAARYLKTSAFLYICLYKTRINTLGFYFLVNNLCVLSLALRINGKAHGKVYNMHIWTCLCNNKQFFPQFRESSTFMSDAFKFLKTCIQTFYSWIISNKNEGWWDFFIFLASLLLSWELRPRAVIRFLYWNRRTLGAFLVELLQMLFIQYFKVNILLLLLPRYLVCVNVLFCMLTVYLR